MILDYRLQKDFSEYIPKSVRKHSGKIALGVGLIASSRHIPKIKEKVDAGRTGIEINTRKRYKNFSWVTDKDNEVVKIGDNELIIRSKDGKRIATLNLKTNKTQDFTNSPKRDRLDEMHAVLSDQTGYLKTGFDNISPMSKPSKFKSYGSAALGGALLGSYPGAQVNDPRIIAIGSGIGAIGGLAVGKHLYDSSKKDWDTIQNFRQKYPTVTPRVTLIRR